MTLSYFSTNQIINLISAILIIGLAVFLFEKGKTRLSIISLVIGAFVLGCFVALLNPFLTIWDESYHALVAKNLIDNPFYPVLYKNPVLDYDYKLWTDNYIWLHKQPLFLWQMALSMKLFGVNEFSLRLPSIIMHAIIPFFIYKIGNISLNKRTGFYGALFFSLAFFPLELVAGQYATDHNDLAFLFYITASFWAWVEYNQSHKKQWLILIGIFAGSAVLVKWLMGLLVFVCWGFTYLIEINKIFQFRRYIPMIKSLAISFLVFIPWQLYILYRFPVEAKHELLDFSDHFTKVYHGHGGSFWYHFEITQRIYGQSIVVSVLLVLSLITLFRGIPKLIYRTFIIGAIVFVYLFYSIAATKMPAFCIIVSPLIFIGISTLILTFKKYFEKLRLHRYINNALHYLVIIVICFFLLNLNQIHTNHTMYKSTKNCNRQRKLDERSLISNLKNILPDKNYIIFNTNFTQGGNIPFMFYSNYTAYRCIPTIEECNKVREEGYNIAIIDFEDLPDYIQSDKDIIKIKANISRGN